MPSARRQKPAHRSSGKRRPVARPSGGKNAGKSGVPRPASPPAKRPAAKARPTPSSKPETAPPPELALPLPGGRRHVLSLSFVRDGDEFLARLETDAGQITELKNRSLDQLLTLVAGELEDLLE